jgi:hypothetical protein
MEAGEHLGDESPPGGSLGCSGMAVAVAAAVAAVVAVVAAAAADAAGAGRRKPTLFAASRLGEIDDLERG